MEKYKTSTFIPDSIPVWTSDIETRRLAELCRPAEDCRTCVARRSVQSLFLASCTGAGCSSVDV